MKLGEMFPGKYLSASDIDEDIIVTIEKVTTVQVVNEGRQEDKPAIAFRELDKMMVLNKTNATTIAKVLNSDDTDDWEGQRIGLFVATVEAFGKQQEAIRVKGRAPKPAAQAATASTRAQSRKDALTPPDAPPPLDDEPVW